MLVGWARVLGKERFEGFAGALGDGLQKRFRELHAQGVFARGAGKAARGLRVAVHEGQVGLDVVDGRAV